MTDFKAVMMGKNARIHALEKVLVNLDYIFVTRKEFTDVELSQLSKYVRFALEGQHQKKANLELLLKRKYMFPQPVLKQPDGV